VPELSHAVSPQTVLCMLQLIGLVIVRKAHGVLLGEGTSISQAAICYRIRNSFGVLVDDDATVIELAFLMPLG
jgi:hypothetical protein